MPFLILTVYNYKCQFTKRIKILKFVLVIKSSSRSLQSEATKTLHCHCAVTWRSWWIKRYQSRCSFRVSWLTTTSAWTRALCYRVLTWWCGLAVAITTGPPLRHTSCLWHSSSSTCHWSVMAVRCRSCGYCSVAVAAVYGALLLLR